MLSVTICSLDHRTTTPGLPKSSRASPSLHGHDYIHKAASLNVHLIYQIIQNDPLNWQLIKYLLNRIKQCQNDRRRASFKMDQVSKASQLIEIWLMLFVITKLDTVISLRFDLIMYQYVPRTVC